MLNISPLAATLNDAISIYKDEQDAGVVVFTPFYLLAGISLPLWILPAPCDVVDSAGFNLLPLLSGLLAVGIGDTMASAVGSTLGTHHWTGNYIPFICVISGKTNNVVRFICNFYFAIIC